MSKHVQVPPASPGPSSASARPASSSGRAHHRDRQRDSGVPFNPPVGPRAAAASVDPRTRASPVAHRGGVPPAGLRAGVAHGDSRSRDGGRHSAPSSSRSRFPASSSSVYSQLGPFTISAPQSQHQTPHSRHQQGVPPTATPGSATPTSSQGFDAVFYGPHLPGPPLKQLDTADLEQCIASQPPAGPPALNSHPFKHQIDSDGSGYLLVKRARVAASVPTLEKEWVILHFEWKRRQTRYNFAIQALRLAPAAVDQEDMFHKLEPGQGEVVDFYMAPRKTEDDMYWEVINIDTHYRLEGSGRNRRWTKVSPQPLSYFVGKGKQKAGD